MAARPHPATWLIVWACYAALLQSFGLSVLAGAAVLTLPLVLGFARRRGYLLLRRARWLFLSIAVMFALATPGERLPGALGDMGVTWDGLSLAAEHVLRLSLLLASLALLHEHLKTEGLMAGLYWLLSPLSGLRRLRERIVVRLMLVLEQAEKPVARDWRAWLDSGNDGDSDDGAAQVTLSTGRAGAVDWIVLGFLGFLGAAAFLLGGHR